eukprot:TRINITY_DN2426_c0_g1_i1.p1 TRINITY_DN2426_c0_g1~~TRINITY_DN2426_c0_g1_i1.p1  ORF type:complete len:621 (-),score=185.05 TRINITY_DN2426_c0_g1_i1:208-2070(-)
MQNFNTVSVGEYIASLLEHIGVKEYFAVPGDFNLLLLDELLKNKRINLIGCCNELNAGYAADGYARAHGVSALVITYSVGGLSVVNAVAGAYAEDLPIIVISGGLNSNTRARGEYVHHSLGELRYDYVRRIFKEITAESVTIEQASEVVGKVTSAVKTALQRRKPVYIEVACNIVAEKVSAPHFASMNHLKEFFTSDVANLALAVEHAALFLNQAKAPVIVGGSRLRGLCKNTQGMVAKNPFNEFVEISKYATAMMPDAKGFLPDSHYSNIGIYWGDASIPSHATRDIIESADVYVFVGPVFTDYSTCGNTTKTDMERTVLVDPHSVKIGNQIYQDVELSQFITELTKRISPNSTSLDNYYKMIGDEKSKIALWGGNFKKQMTQNPSDDVTHCRLLYRLQALILDEETEEAIPVTILAETGDAWFSALKLRLRQTDLFEVQMTYGSIGWSVGATLGYALATAGPLISPNNTEGARDRDVSHQERRLVALIGDGSFQLTAQEVATMVKYFVNPIIILINNHGYTIEEEIHKGSYNKIKNWNYAGLMAVFNQPQLDGEAFGPGCGFTVKTNGELDDALIRAKKHRGGPTLIEVQISPDDCNNELPVWGKCVSKSNARPPMAK